MSVLEQSFPWRQPISCLYKIIHNRFKNTLAQLLGIIALEEPTLLAHGVDCRGFVGLGFLAQLGQMNIYEFLCRLEFVLLARRKR